MLSKHAFTLPFYLPRILREWDNWRGYLLNYLFRKRAPAEYRARNGLRLVDNTGTLAGTIAVVFVRREYGTLDSYNTIVDIGAHLGSFAVYAATSLPQARIYCYEPERDNFTALARNIRINGLESRVSVFECAVGADSQQRDLAVHGSVLNSFHVVQPGADRQTVSCTTLREIFSAHKLATIDLLKINCEGAEYEILHGCSKEELDKIANIRLEYHNLDTNGRNGTSLSSFLERVGFKIERFTRYGRESGFIWATRPLVANLVVSSLVEALSLAV